MLEEINSRTGQNVAFGLSPFLAYQLLGFALNWLSQNINIAAVKKKGGTSTSGKCGSSEFVYVYIYILLRCSLHFL